MAKKKKFAIHITKRSSATFVLNKISSSMLYHVQQKFAYLPPGYKFQPKYRLLGVKGVQVKLVQPDGSFPMGLFSDVVEYLTDVQKKKVTMSTEVMEHFLPLDDFFEGGIKDDIFSEYEFDGNPVMLRDYQLGALQAAFENRNGLLNLSTGAGKCLGPDTKLKVKLPKDIIEKYKDLIKGD